MRALADFSFYDWVVHSASTQHISMRPLGSASEQSARQLTTSVRAMLHWCRIVEQLTLERHSEGALIFAGFERVSRVRPVLKRYQRLSAVVERLVIFGERDESVPLDARIVDVTGEALAREWFLVVQAPQYAALLAARDLDGFSPTGPLANRRFVGVTLGERSLVEAAVRRLEQHASRA